MTRRTHYKLPGRLIWSVLLLTVTALIGNVPVSGQTATILTEEKVRDLALAFNRTYLSAKEEVSKASSEIAIARAGALPEISASAGYAHNFILPSFFVQIADDIVEFKTGFKHNFNGAISLRQSLWQGGKVITALSIARLYRRYAESQERAARASVILNADIMYYSAILEQSRLAATEKEYDAASYNAGVVEKKYGQGLVSQFELLRARVQKLNLEPALLQARSDVSLAEKRLKSFLGLDLNEEIVLADDPTDTSITDLPPLPALVDSARIRRPELKEAALLSDITRKAVRVAAGDFLPSFEAVSDYRWESVSDDFTLRGNRTESWTAGVTVSIPIFTGGERLGELQQRKSEHHQARLSEAQLRDDIVLEVEAAYDRLLQAKEALDIQAETIAQAEEGLRIANLRYETGIGTLLEVLSAQAALTHARTSKAEALYFFRTARSRLVKATGLETP